MRRLFSQGYNLPDNLRVTLSRLGYWLDRDTKILDYGCGSGAFVYELRDLGFDAYGFDIHDRVAYRSPEDCRWFRFVPNASRDTSNFEVAADHYRVPFEDNSFDLIVSTSVVEHVLDLSAMMAEVARVVRPTGCTLHVYAKRSRWIEPHLYVPLGGRLQTRWWFYLWALLGVRCENQELAKMSVKETVDNNLLYCQTGLNYLPPRELLAICGRYFQGVRDIDADYNFMYTVRGQAENVLAALRARYPLRALSLCQGVSALFTDQKITHDAAAVNRSYMP